MGFKPAFWQMAVSNCPHRSIVDERWPDSAAIDDRTIVPMRVAELSIAHLQVGMTPSTNLHGEHLH